MPRISSKTSLIRNGLKITNPIRKQKKNANAGKYKNEAIPAISPMLKTLPPTEAALYKANTLLMPQITNVAATSGADK